MTIQYNIPDVDISQIRVIRHAEWIYQGKGPKEYRDRVMLENLIRLVVHASSEYQRGAAAIRDFY